MDDVEDDEGLVDALEGSVVVAVDPLGLLELVDEGFDGT